MENVLKPTKIHYVFAVCVATLVKLLIGYFPYSGEGDSPRFGDYEAQRHWMELTYNLPPNEWYVRSSRNDLDYWGIDYPPLTAFHELLMASLSHLHEPASVELFTSRGYETISHRLFVRLSVIVSELLSYVPAAYFACRAIRTNAWTQFSTFVALIMSPCLTFVDHGHFQYNSVALGFLLGAAGCILHNKLLPSAFLFTCAFLFKQTLLYFSPVFFAYMLGTALRKPTFFRRFILIAELGLVVFFTVAISLFPFISGCIDADCVRTQLINIIARVFPFGRGVFEDYVGNMWIVISPIIRLRSASQEFLRTIGFTSTLATLLACLPVCWCLARNPRKELFPLGLAACSFSFYLFSWMVHEKAVLLPLTSVILSSPILTVTGNADLVLRVTEASVLSLWKLMTYDHCSIGGVSVSVIGYVTLRYFLSIGMPRSKRKQSDTLLLRLIRILSIFTNGFAFAGFILDLAFAPPERFPYLWPYIISVGCCGTFLLSWYRISEIVGNKGVSSANVF